MPKFLENKLKREYGADSSIPYEVMNVMGVMHGDKIAAKGRAMEAKHERHEGQRGRLSGNHRQARKRG